MKKPILSVLLCGVFAAAAPAAVYTTLDYENARETNTLASAAITATNIVDVATNALDTTLRGVIASASPGDYANVSNLAYSAVQTETDPVWESEKWDYATTASLGYYIPWSAAASHSGSDHFSLVLERYDGNGNYLAVTESGTGGDGPFLIETYMTASSVTNFSYYRPRFYVGGYTGNYFAYYYDVTNAVASLDVALRGEIASATNAVDQAYIREKLGVYLYIGADGGVYVHTGE